MSDQREGQVTIDSESDIVAVRKTAREQSVALGFGVTDVTRIVTAASELARNVFRHAGSGLMRWRHLAEGQAAGLELVFEDRGPGIADVEQAMQPGYSTAGGLGMGLPGAKRLMDELAIRSEPGTGTVVTVRKWWRK